MSHTPVVSIAVPVYNGRETLAAALESALSQTYEDFELVVVDNASTDGTRDIVTGLRDPRIRLVVNDRNRGFLFNHNRSIRESRGRFVKPLHADDLLFPRCLERMVPLLEEHPGMGMVFSPRRVVLSDPGDPRLQAWERAYGDLHTHFVGLTTVNDGRDLAEQCLAADLPDNWVGEPCAMLLRRSAIERIGLFSPTVGAKNDLEFALRMMALFEIGFVDEPLAVYRRTAGTLADRLTPGDWLEPMWMIEALDADPRMRARLPGLRAARRRQWPIVGRRLRREVRAEPAVTGRMLRELGAYLAHRAAGRAGRDGSLSEPLDPVPRVGADVEDHRPPVPLRRGSR